MAEGQPWEEPRPLPYSRRGTLTEVPPCPQARHPAAVGKVFSCPGQVLRLLPCTQLSLAFRPPNLPIPIFETA